MNQIEILEILMGAGVLFLGLAGSWYTLRKKQGTDVSQEEPGLPSTEDTTETTTEAAAHSVEAQPVSVSSTGGDLKSALGQTSRGFWGRLKATLTSEAVESEDWFEEVEEVLYTSDLGPHTVQALLSEVQKTPPKTQDELRGLLSDQMKRFFLESQSQEMDSSNGMQVQLVTGVNGAGKTTTIGKLAAQATKAGKKVLIIAGDTFRAAAEGQLAVWAERAQADFFQLEETRSPSAVVYQGLEYAKSQGFDLVLIDTAGRLHTQGGLMEELKKVARTIEKQLGRPADEVIFIVDANQGQNAVIQARQFHEALKISRVILTKLDGSSKGGTVVAISAELKLPIWKIGVGEGIDDLRNFEPNEFVDALFQ